MSLQTVQGIVHEKRFISDDVIFLSLKLDKELVFQAGQFVTLKITNGSQTKPKSYSILNPPSEKGKLDFCIKIIPSGFASEIFQKTKKGDQFEIKGSFGHFIFDTTTSHEHWFIGAGTGVTPLYSMIKQYLPHSSKKKFILLLGVRTQKDLLFHQEFMQWARKYQNFTYMPTLSRESWAGLQGRVQAHLPKDLQNKTFYICGLKELVLETKELLAQKNVAPKDIKSERYS